MSDDNVGHPVNRVEQYAGLSGPQRLLALAFVCAGLGYLAWRPFTFNPEAQVWSWTIYGAEILGFVSSLAYLAIGWRLTNRASRPFADEARADVLVTVGDESIDVVRRTVTAAQRVRQAGEVWLLDARNRLEIVVLAQELGCRYQTSAPGAEADTSCLNEALRRTSTEFVVVLDAHQAPAATLLAETLGFFADERVAFVQTPLDYYNLDSFQHRVEHRESVVWSEQAFLHRVVQPGLDRWNATPFCGSCAVLRRGALEDVGGFSPSAAGAEMQTSLRLHRRGWRSVYYPRALVFGLAPTTVAGFMRERWRVARNAARAGRREGLLFAGGLTARQRLAYATAAFAVYGAWQRVVLYLAPAIALAMGALPVARLDASFVAHLVPYYGLATWLAVELARGHGRPLFAEQYRMLRCGAFVAGTCSALLHRLGIARLPWSDRPFATQAQVSWPPYLVLACNVAALPVGLGHYWIGGGPPLLAVAACAAGSASVIAAAAAAITHVRRTARFRRREYRFPLPVPLRIATPGGTCLGLATDVSPLGFRLAGQPVSGLQPGAEFAGEMLLPTGPLPIVAAVRDVRGDRRATAGRDAPVAGCELRWGLADDRSPLELFLYGSDLQWRLNGLEDRIRTPLQRLDDVLRGVRREPRRLVGRQWSPLLYKRVNSEHEAGVGFISSAVSEGAERTVVSLGVLPKNGRLYAEEVTPHGPRGVVGRVAHEEVLGTHSAPIYLYKLTA